MKNGVHRLLVLLFCLGLSGCGFGSVGQKLSTAIMNQNDPETVRDGAPAYLMLLDGLIADDPCDPTLLRGGATLYSLYAAAFADDPGRSKRLAQRGRGYGQRALCAQNSAACCLAQQPPEDFAATLARVNRGDLPALNAFAVSWLVWIKANSDEWGALADLPKVEQVFARMLVLDEEFDHGSIHYYLGILQSLRPAAMGGNPEGGRRHFERAIELSQGRDLSFLVEFAASYARSVYDRSLHDRLLQEVLAAEPEVPGLTLVNVLAQRRARQLLDSAEDYF